MPENSVPFNKPFIAGKELYYISQAVERSHLSGAGHFTECCHQWLEKRLGCAKTLLTHSCTAALEMAAILFDIQPGDEIIMPSFTFVSTANAFAVRGGVPVFVDIRPDTLNIDETKIESAITSKTKAIAPVHYAGVSCDMDTIQEIAAKHHLWIVEDAAHSLLCKTHGRNLGTIGHVGCLSFHETKNIISGEGGALLINDKSLEERAEIIWEKGTNRREYFRGQADRYAWKDIGSSYLPSDIIAAFLFAQLEHADEINQKRHSAFLRYHDGLKSLERSGALRLPHWEKHHHINGHLFYVLAASQEERAALMSFLTERDIATVFHYQPLHSSPAGLRYGRADSELGITDSVSQRLLRLPMFYEMQDRDIDRVISSIHDFYNKNK